MPQVEQGGAAMVIVAQDAQTSLPALVVRETRAAVAVAAAAFYGEPARELQIAAVTGTNGKTTTVGLLRHLLDAPDAPSPLGRRDRAILELLYASGLRLSELVGLDIEDVNLRARIVRVTGKGDKERLVPLNQPACDAVDDYRKVRRKHVPGGGESR